MRQSPRPMGHLSFPFALLLSLCMLVLLLTPTASALEAARGNSNGHPTESVMMQSEDGRVTDEDGRIGNSSRGADRAPAQDDFAHGILPDEPGTPTMPEDADGSNGSEGGIVVQDGATPARDGANEILDPGTMNGSAENAETSGPIGWIVAILVVLAVALVILALLPKRNKSR
ncbi:MAG: hypothetical protein E7625_03825 [Ruminococcaceae bacterium]|nr:hypothetical protein [Oscillospiraceae bacterium]